MRLYLIRHARPDIVDGLCYGSTDLAVTQHEHQQVMTTLAPVLPRQVPIFTSPLQRCRELATRLADALQCDSPIQDARLAEMHFGAWEMRAWNEIPRAEVDAWAADLHGYRPGGGENVLAMAQRVQAFYAELQSQQRSCAAIVCHAGTMRLLCACVRHASPIDIAQDVARTSHKIAYGELIVLDC